MAFTAEEIDYLDSKADGEARRARENEGGDDSAMPEPQVPKAARARRAEARA